MILHAPGAMKKVKNPAAVALGRLGWKAAFKVGAQAKGTRNSWSDDARAKRLANGRKRKHTEKV